ncbi:hypothetical protein ACFWN1_21840 [Streptomyces sp. NPDC058459]|uniref:hypothetical protein n=1 Tax=Streptomyces sp. NPDC058459 TaxID=3346508 RepID=UPI00365B9556
MSGGEQHWNEDTQRWEAGPGSDSPPTPPPPSRPAHAPAPVWPPADPTRPTEPPAPEWPQATPTEADDTPASTWPPADRRTPGTPADSSASAGPAASATAGKRSPDEPVPSAASSAPGWPPADRRTPPPSSWPLAGASSAGASSAGETVAESAAHAEPPSAASWPPAELPAAWPPADSSSDTSAWPPADPPPRSDPGRRVLWSVIVGAAAAAVAVSLVLALVVGRDTDDGRSGQSRGHVSSAPVTRSPSPTTSSPTPTPTPSPSAPPAGYELRDDDEGFRVAVPEGWTRATAPSEYGMAVVNFRSPDRERRLQVYEVAEASPKASFELYLSDRTPKPGGFKKLKLTDLDEGDFTGSRLEYLAGRIRDEPEVGTWHVYDERFVAADGKIYALAAYGADADGREDELELLTTALAWFCPPGLNCDPSGNAALD